MKFVKEVFAEFSSDHCTTMSAALAYYTVFALAPLLYLLLTVLTYGLYVAYDAGDAETRAKQMLERQAGQLLGSEAASEEVSRILMRDQESGGTWYKVLFSFLGIVVGATGVVAAIQDSLNRVWSVIPDPESSSVAHFLTKRLLSLAMIMGLGFLLLVSLIVSTVLAQIGEKLTAWAGIDASSADLINHSVQAVATFVIFAAIFKFMPDAVVRWKDVMLGAFLTTVLFLVGRIALQWYLGRVDPGAQLGSAAASLSVLLVWIYYSSMIFFLGAEATFVYAKNFGGGVAPERGAVQVVQTLAPRQ
ncbi:YihY/virulence factor BrkB family protein [Roseiconus nitratireducens]|uniref:YihY/virulence factor BrkB family protein n=1 Tax=Roseiconus nitratireducens TaxID=2605748 RepID=A0A5M6D5M5_9BACT|nr:YihY/virulence factor BrkB family protein [Roseiconus nitratireducens]KAA5542653.1 YihY/virulence factor BrkB family protein [Roseiconus nitratireducens]